MDLTEIKTTLAYKIFNFTVRFVVGILAGALFLHYILFPIIFM